MKHVVLILTLLTSPVAAHDFKTLEVDSFHRIGDGPFIEILINNTVSGRRVVCGVYNILGKLVAADQRHTDNLVTKVLVMYEGRDESSVACAFTN